MNNTQKGRAAILAWEQNKQQNAFLRDVNLQNVLRRYMGEIAYDEARANFEQLGADLIRIDELAKVEDRVGNHPRLERYSGHGERIERIEFHPNHDKIGALVWQSGVMAVQAQAGTAVQQMGLYYLLGQNGEAGYMCSLACTSGLIRALQQAADDDLREKYLPDLLNPDYEQMQHGAQFLTEIQGGSDVGANAVHAQQADDGSWRISGEKWFCSNINADQFLMTARATYAAGTRGLGLFLVPRNIERAGEQITNGFHLRRLKDKLGTRTLASAEVDFVEAVAYPVGDIERGFKTMVELVLNTSRLMNAVACAGMMQRVSVEAGQYACHREAFGQSIANYPMVQEAVADILSETYAATASSFYLAHLLDKIETHTATDADKDTYRMLVNINKYSTSIAATEMVHRGIEILGGNGAIESFSILPRLYRDAIVLESWEGTHNVLAVQVLRDVTRYGLHEAFFNALKAQIDSATHPNLTLFAEQTRAALARLGATLQLMNERGSAYAQAHARRFIDMAGRIAQASLMLAEAQWEHDNNVQRVKQDVLAYFINQHLLPGYDPMQDEGYLPRLERLMQSV